MATAINVDDLVGDVGTAVKQKEKSFFHFIQVGPAQGRDGLENNRKDWHAMQVKSPIPKWYNEKLWRSD